MESGQQQPAPGWYPDQQGTGERFWDGTQWTDQIRATAAPQPASGWYPDPQGAGERYWDGAQWTEQLRAVAPQGPAPGWYSNPQGPGQRYWDGANWTEQYQAETPQAGTQKRGGGFFRNCLIATLAVLLGGALLIGGCVLLIAGGVDEAQKEQDKKGITMAEFDSIDQGMTQQAVEQQLGPPDDSQQFEQNIPAIRDQPYKSSCIYYPEKGKQLFEGHSFQFCFDNEKLTSKNAY